MATSISVSESTKEDFTEEKPEDLTHTEFVDVLLEVYQAYNGEPVDHDELASKLEQKLISKVELGAYRGSAEAIKSELNGGITK